MGECPMAQMVPLTPPFSFSPAPLTVAKTTRPLGETPFEASWGGLLFGYLPLTCSCARGFRGPPFIRKYFPRQSGVAFNSGVGSSRAWPSQWGGEGPEDPKRAGHHPVTWHTVKRGQRRGQTVGWSEGDGVRDVRTGDTEGWGGTEIQTPKANGDRSTGLAAGSQGGGDGGAVLHTRGAR